MDSSVSYCAEAVGYSRRPFGNTITGTVPDFQESDIDYRPGRYNAIRGSYCIVPETVRSQPDSLFFDQSENYPSKSPSKNPSKMISSLCNLSSLVDPDKTDCYHTYKHSNQA